ncbi:MAG TPA: hypothetical protein DD638_06100 [Pasteurellaceae bacterium]|nr:hypothetical protein [Pasteurellaceae bacterium]
MILRDQFKFRPATSPKVLALQQEVLKRTFTVSGVLAKLKTRHELLDKYKLQVLLQAKIEYYKNATRLDTDNIKDALMVPGSISALIVG